MQKEVDDNCILFVSTYPPRECGIATFTKDLSDAIEKKFSPFLKSKILAMNNNGVNIYNYPKKVVYQLSDTSREDYVRIAERINDDDSIKIVSIQHEFGIFGGEYGEYIIDFLETLKKPSLLTFHSILPNPDRGRVKVVRKICSNVSEVVVMTPKGMDILKKQYKIDTPIKVIPHGIPQVAYESQDNLKKQLGYEGKILLSSFGMINRGKGYEYVIDSLPEVVKKFPNLIYLIVGATHPVVRKHEGEKYRNFLDKKIKKLGLQDNVKFYNKYVTLKEIIQYVKASDIYISSVLTPEQITSGTLVYAMGCGRAVVSTPFLHARDVINPDRGILLPDFRNPSSFKNAILDILDNKLRLKDMEQTTYEFTRHMTWPNVALSYGDEIKKYMSIPDTYFEELPRINTKHIKRLTDDFGIIQFARYTSPNRNSGYTLDDNSRALIVAAKLYSRSKDNRFLDLVKTYLNYTEYVQNGEGKFYNLVSKDKTVNKSSWSEEAHGRAMRALSFICSVQALPQEIREKAKKIFIKSVPVTSDFESSRAVSYVISSFYFSNKESYSEDNLDNVRKFADKLVSMYEHNSSPGWRWFEPELTYSNSRMCESLFYSYMMTQDKKYLDVALESLNFLILETFENNIFMPIGQNGWYKKNGRRAYYDQQPLDVSAMVQALALAYKITQNQEYEKRTLQAFQWFLGKNTLNQVVYNESTGGCCDGLDKKDLNLNQGAESTLAYLSARLEMDELV